MHLFLCYSSQGWDFFKKIYCINLRFLAATVLILVVTAVLPAHLTTSRSTPPTASTCLRERSEPPPELLLASRQSPASGSTPDLMATKFEAIVAQRSIPTHSLEFNARHFASSLLSRRELLASRGMDNEPIDMVDIVRLRWSSAPSSAHHVRVYINFERGVHLIWSLSTWCFIDICKCFTCIFSNLFYYILNSLSTSTIWFALQLFQVDRFYRLSQNVTYRLLFCFLAPPAPPPISIFSFHLIKHTFFERVLGN